MAPRLGIIADDLSGAADSGLQFARFGCRTSVAFEPALDIGGADVLVIDADSRGLDSPAAAIRAGDAARSLGLAGCQRLYKKIDSTLRGNLGAELDALLDQLPGRVALVSSSFPRAGRVTLQGRLSVRGVPLEATEFARDPLWPATDSRVAAVIGRQSARTVGQIGLDTVRAGAPAVVAQLESLVGQGASIVVADAETEADLAVLGEVTAASDRVIGVGSAGLAGGLARSLGLAPVPAFDEPASTPTALGPVLCVVGSVNPVARGQLESLGATEPCRLVSVDVGRVLAGESAFEAATAARMACQELRSGRCVALTLASDEAAHAAYRRRAETVGRGEVARELMAALGSAARLVLESGVLPAGLFLTGGDTARAVCRALGARGLLVEREVAAGIPQGRLLGGSFAGLPVVTKAGGFGESDALVRAVQVLRRVGN